MDLVKPIEEDEDEQEKEDENKHTRMAMITKINKK